MNGTWKHRLVLGLVMGGIVLLMACGNKSSDDPDVDADTDVVTDVHTDLTDDADVITDVPEDGDVMGDVAGDGEDDVDLDAAGDADAAHMVAFNIRFVNSALAPVTGVEACWYQDDSVPCQTSAGAEGRVQLILPPDTAGAFQISHPDYYDFLQYHTTSSDHLWEDWTFLVLTPTEIAATYLLLGLTDDPAAEDIMVNTEYTSVAPVGLGATVSIEPTAGDGPYYYNSANIPDPSLTSASQSSFVSLQNVPPGEYSVTVELDSTPCHSAGTTAGPVPIEVVAGYGTVVSFSCL